jgi:two-component system KDP operon response regulator KdpE
MTTPTMPHILVIDDEIQIRRLLEITLDHEKYKVTLASAGEEGLALAAMHKPDLIILDLGLPDKDGLEILKSLRQWSSVPIIVLSVRDSEHDIITALDAGADDYLTKPFRTGELLARIRTSLRRNDKETAGEEERRFGTLTVDFSSHSVTRDGKAVKLTPTEFSLLALFARNAGRVLTHRYILEQVWGHAYAEETQYTRIYVSQLRKKIESDPAHPQLIQTESGIGYRMSGSTE